MQIDYEIKLDFDDVLVRPKRSNIPSRKSIDLTRTLKCSNSGRTLECIPIVAANMSTTGTFAMAKALNRCQMLTALHKFYPLDDLLEFFRGQSSAKMCFYTLGIKDEDFEKLDAFAKELEPDKICLDIANGYSCYFVDKVKRVREKFSNTILMVGNVATAEMTQELFLAGADIIKIGIGPGSACTTRLMTGVGVPQLSAIAECADAAHGLGGLVCGDGGCVTSGDVAKAIGAGADLVMLGGLLAGTDECSGKRTNEGFEFYGMASVTAQEKFYDEVKNYTAAEGKTVTIPKKGPVNPILREIKGGLRSACSYVGAAKLKDLSKCTTFIRVSRTHNIVFGG